MKELIINPVTLKKNGEEVPIHGITDASKVSDVQINGESILNEDGVANIPKANQNTFGLVKTETYGINMSSTGHLYCATLSQRQFDTLNDYYPVSLGTMRNIKENLVTSVVDFEEGTSEQATFVEESDLEHYVKDTDMAQFDKLGLTKLNADYAFTRNSEGSVYAMTKTKSQYPSLSSNAFIGKGTLENIKESLVKSVVDKPFQIIVRQEYEFTEATKLIIDVDNAEHIRILLVVPPNTLTSVSNYGLISIDDENGTNHYGIFEFGTLVGNSVSYAQVAYGCYDLGDIPTMCKWGSSGGNPQFTVRGGAVNNIAIANDNLPTFKVSKIKLSPIVGKIKIAIYAR